MSFFEPNFGEEWSSGAGTSALVPDTYRVALFGRGFFIDLRQYDRRTLPMLRPGADQGSEAGEGSRSNEGFWIRSGQDWSLGAGQDFYDRTTSSRRRFRSSHGVFVFDEGKVSLLHDTELDEAIVDSGLLLLDAGGTYYRCGPNTFEMSTDLVNWTTVTATGLAGVDSICTDGTNIYVCDGAKIMSGVIGGGSVANLGAFAADRVWYANGRLLASNGNVLAEIAAGGGSTTLAVSGAGLSHLGTGWTWTSVVGAPNGIYAAGNGGGNAEVWYFGVDEATGALAVGILATPFVRKEEIYVLEFYGGLMFFGTAKGVRVAAVDGNRNTLDYGALIRIEGGVRWFVFEEGYAWFGWSDYDTERTGCGRLDLSELVNAEGLVFAYASDLMAATQGDSVSAMRVDSRMFFAIDQVGIYAESLTDYVASAELRTGWIGYGDVEAKVAVAAGIRHEPLAGSVAVSIVQLDETEALLGTSDIAGSVRPESNFDANTTISERFELVFDFAPDETLTDTPVLVLWKLLALPSGPRTDEIIVPLMVSESVEQEEYDVNETYLWLKSVEADGIPGPYQEGALTWTVQLDAVRRAPTKWNDDNTALEGLILVRLLTVEV